MKYLIIFIVCLFGFLSQAQTDTTITVNFQEDYLTESFAYTSAECRVDVHGGGLYSITYKLAGPDTVGGVGITRYNTIRQYENVSGAVALQVLDEIKADLLTRSENLQSQYNRVDALRTRFQAQYQDLQNVWAAFTELKVWAQGQ